MFYSALRDEEVGPLILALLSAEIPPLGLVRPPKPPKT